MTCVYNSVASQIYGATHLIPWIVPLAVSAASIGRDRNGKWGKQIVMILYSFWLTGITFILYAAQTALNIQMPNPYCPEYTSYSHPSLEMFYVSSLATYIGAFTYMWNLELAWSYWVLIQVVVIFPPFVLVAFSQNTWYQLFIAAIVGISTTIAFVVFIYLESESISYLLHQTPFTWFSAIDSYVRTDAQQREELFLK